MHSPPTPEAEVAAEEAVEVAAEEAVAGEEVAEEQAERVAQSKRKSPRPPPNKLATGSLPMGADTTPAADSSETKMEVSANPQKENLAQSVADNFTIDGGPNGPHKPTMNACAQNPHPVQSHWLQSSLLRKLLLPLLCLTLIAAPVQESKAFNWSTEWTQIAHTLQNTWGTITNYAEWLTDHIYSINQLTELIENNVLTKAIRGFNELMTALQTDISDVLGTITTLAQAPMDIFNEVMSIPNSVMGLLEEGSSAFTGVFNQAMDIFSVVGKAQSFGEGLGDIFASSGDAFGFMNQISGLRTSLNSDFLKGSQQRNQMMKSWEKAKYGGDAIQMQSTQIDILGTIARNQNRDSEMQSMDRLQDTADRMNAYMQQKARAARSFAETSTYIQSQFAF